MFDRLRLGSGFRCAVLTVVALVALPACVDEAGSDGADDDVVEASVDPLVSPGEGGSGSNMLTNPGFETAFSSNDWWLGNTWGSTAGRAFRTGAARRGGSYGLRLSGLAFMIHTEIGTRAGTRYEISAFARKGAYGKTSCWMEVQFYPNGGIYKTANVSTTEWKAYGITVVAPAGTTTARVQVRRDPGLTSSSQTDEPCDWDDFSFRRAY